VHIGIGRIDNKVNIFAIEECLVIAVCIAVEVCFRNRLTCGIKLDNCNNVYNVIVLRFEEFAVDVTSTSAVSDYGDVEFFLNVQAPFKNFSLL